MSAFAVMQNMRQQTQQSAAAFDNALMASTKRSNVDSDLLGSTRFGFSQLELEQLFTGEPEERRLSSTSASGSQSSRVTRSATGRGAPASRMSAERQRYRTETAAKSLIIKSISNEIPRDDPGSAEGSVRGGTLALPLSPSVRDKYSTVLPKMGDTDAPVGILRAIHMEAVLHANLMEIPPPQRSGTGTQRRLKKGRHTWASQVFHPSNELTMTKSLQPSEPGREASTSASALPNVNSSPSLESLRMYSSGRMRAPHLIIDERLSGVLDYQQSVAAASPAALPGDGPSNTNRTSDTPEVLDAPIESDPDHFMWSRGHGAHHACGGTEYHEEQDGEAARNCCTAFCGALDRLPTLRPTHPLKLIWDWTIIILVLYVAVIVPFQATFLIEPPPGKEDVPNFDNMSKFDFAVDCAFIADIFVSFNTAVQLRDGTLLTSHAVIANAYLRSFFFVDLVSSVPVDWFITGSANVGALAVIKCLRLLRIGRLMKKLDQLPGANLFRVVKLLLFFIIITHWVACLWYLSAVLGDGETWVMVQAVDLADHGGDVTMMTVGYWYMMSVYWSLTTLTTVGYGDITPVSQGEVLYTIFAQFVGIMVSAVITGQVAVLLASYEAAYGRYQHRIELFRAFVDLHPLPSTLSQRMLRCIDHFFEKDQGLDADDILGQVSPALKREIMLDRIGGIVASCHLLRGAPEGLISMLVNSLVHEPYYTGDYVVRQGDPAHKLYFVYAGVLEVIPRAERNMTIAHHRISEDEEFEDHPLLRKGDYFGGKEMATSPGTYEHHVRVKDPAELWMLRAEDLVKCVAHFPDFAPVLQRSMKGPHN